MLSHFWTLEPFPDWTDRHPDGHIYGLLKTQLGVDGVQGVRNPSHVVSFFLDFAQTTLLLREPN
jgi:hypothetical protein